MARSLQLLHAIRHNSEQTNNDETFRSDPFRHDTLRYDPLFQVIRQLQRLRHSARIGGRALRAARGLVSARATSRSGRARWPARRSGRAESSRAAPQRATQTTSPAFLCRSPSLCLSPSPRRVQTSSELLTHWTRAAFFGWRSGIRAAARREGRASNPS